MPWLPFYAVEEDMRWVFGALSAEPELAFLVSSGDKRWIAQKSKEYTEDCRVGLWHIPSGPLPLLRGKRGADGTVDDPWKGWREERTGADPTLPYFGPGHVGVIWLNARVNGRKNGAVGLSSFEWIGSRYVQAPDASERFWRKLGRTLKKQAIRVPRGGPWDGPHPEIWALPESLKQFVLGHDRDLNP
jgi:hypothetical protein